MATKTIEKNNFIVTDVIGIIDSSGSMESMGVEPIQALNAFLDEQKSNAHDDTAVVTIISFNNYVKMLIDHQPIGQVNSIDENQYFPSGGTALNDAICSTIENELSSEKPYNKVVVVITDGMENSSQKWKTADTRESITNVEVNYGWKFIFLGANIDAFATGDTINIPKDRCAQFDSKISGNLTGLARMTSNNINDFRRSRSEGFEDRELTITIPSCNDSEGKSLKKSPITVPFSPDSSVLHLLLKPMVLTRS